MEEAEIGVFGGSGFYKLLEEVREVEVDTPYGKPSALIHVAEIGGKKVAFMPRHGAKHELPPHVINYRANLWAMKQLGVTRVLGPCAAGSLQENVKPGEFVVCDQLVDWTSGRKDSFFDGPKTTHVSTADPYCPELRELLLEAAARVGVKAHARGTMVVVQGPRFSSRAESAFFARNGWNVVNMTGYPEAVLARELEMCYANVSLVTDYDVGVQGIPPVSHEEVLRVFNENNDKLRKLLFEVIPRIPSERVKCGCGSALKGASMS
ncbi:MAG: S-methyl-5'-thioadenosine phosphorylase [Candidatus Micrarchaeia archaeon]